MFLRTIMPNQPFAIATIVNLIKNQFYLSSVSLHWIEIWLSHIILSAEYLKKTLLLQVFTIIPSEVNGISIIVKLDTAVV